MKVFTPLREARVLHEMEGEMWVQETQRRLVRTFNKPSQCRCHSMVFRKACPPLATAGVGSTQSLPSRSAIPPRGATLKPQTQAEELLERSHETSNPLCR